MKRPAVFLIGAGPGDPGLVTVRGAEALRLADVVIYDHRVSSRLLALARPGAERIDVGTLTTGDTALEAISYLIADKARENKVVARLKWGDPFLFDRGGEEALYLHEQGVPFEIVPGLPAAIGVPAYAGVPVTYAGGGDTVTLVRGSEDENRALANVDWTSLARLQGTIVTHAGAQQLAHVLDSLLGHGYPADSGAVIVYGGTRPDQETIGGTVGELARIVHESHRRESGLLIVGRVTGFREHLRWFDARPLFGRRVLVTRPHDQAAELAEPLRALGADTIELPLIRIVPAEDPSRLRQAAAEPGAFDWIVFSSGNAVDAFMTALFDVNRDVRALAGPRLCAVGPATAARLARFGITVDLVPDEHRAEGVVAAIAQQGSLDGMRVLIPRADIGREVIAEQLRDAGAVVTDVVAYRTIVEETPREGGQDVYRMLLEGRIDVVTFTSASAVRQFSRLYGAEQVADLLGRTTVAVIGPVTGEAAAQLNIPVAIQPPVYTIPSLVGAIASHFAPGTRSGEPGHGTA